MNNDNLLTTPKDVELVAKAIAVAEGFYVEGSVPQRYNNPGDIEDQSGKKIVYPTVAFGWQSLYRQIELMISGRSRIYRPGMTWEQIGKLYDGETSYMNWTDNVCKELKVPPTSTLQEFVVFCSVPTQINTNVTDRISVEDKLVG